MYYYLSNRSLRGIFLNNMFLLIVGIGSSVSIIFTLNVFNFSNTSPTIASAQFTNDIHIPIGASIPQTPNPYNPPYFPSITGHVPPGTTVTWYNDDQTFHTVTLQGPPTGPDFFDSGILSPGQSYPHAFPKAGDFQYYCTIHPFMKGVVRVS
jgi:Copper binding proteins, plastocyanin/azurin family